MSVAQRAEITSRGQGLVKLDTEAFRAGSGRTPFRIRHQMCAEPLLQLPALVELCRSLPPAMVEYNAGDLPVAVDPTKTPSNGLSAEETMRRIRDCRSWMVLKYVETIPEYRRLLDTYVDAIAAAGGVAPETYFKRAAFIFVSSPGSVTPLHIDPEENYLLQIAGRKTMGTYPRDDHRVLDERDRERFASGGHRNLFSQREDLPEATRHDLEPGDGLHVPMHTPHFVTNGAEVSISFSVTFQTRLSDRTHGVYWMNHKLRRFGLRPRSPELSGQADAVKYAVFRGLRRIKRVFHSRG